MVIHGGFDLIDLNGIDLSYGATVTGLYARCEKLGDKTIKIGGYLFNGAAVEAEDASITFDNLNSSYTITSAEHIVTVTSLDAVSAQANAGGGGGSYVLPAATESTLGGVMVGDGLSIDASGVLRATGGGGGGSFDGVKVIENTSFIYDSETGGFAATIPGIYLDLVNKVRPVVLNACVYNSGTGQVGGLIFDMRHDPSSSGNPVSGWGKPEFNDNVDGTTVSFATVTKMVVLSTDKVFIKTYALGV